MKRITWLGSSLKELRTFPKFVREETGFKLYQLQQGSAYPECEDLSHVGHAVKQIRLSADLDYYLIYFCLNERRKTQQQRIVYFSKLLDDEHIYILHAYQKKENDLSDMNIARQRLQQLLRDRGEKK